MRQFVFTLIALLAISATYFYFLSVPRNLGSELAVGGVLDLTGADFERLRHNLDGEWEFFFGQLYSPEDFAAGTVSEGTLFDVPGSWHNVGFPLYSSATYRLIVKTDEPSLMMLVPHMPSASVVWVNGEKVFSAGEIGGQTPQSIGGRNAFVPFYPQKGPPGQAEIIVQASNYAWFFSGLNFSIELGRPENLLGDAIFRRLLLGVFIGMLIAMFLYHGILFLHRRGEWAYAASALFCLFAALRFVMEANGLLLLFGNYDHVARSLFQIVAALKAGGLVAFVHLYFEIPVGKVRRIVYAGVFVISVVTSVFPFGTFDSRALFIPIITLCVAFFSLFSSKRLHGNPYNYVFITVLGIFCVMPFLDVTVLSGQFYMSAAPHNLLMVLTKYFMLSASYAEAKSAEQHFSSENAALESLSRMKTEFLANMSHEMKTPLTIISVYVQLASALYQDNKNDEDIVASLKRAQEEIMRVSRMNDNTLRLASMQTGHEIMLRIDTAELLWNSAEAYRSFIEKRENKLTINIPDNLPNVFGSSDRLIQVVANLLTNANKHTENGEISVTAEEEGNYVKISVKDNGAGIDEKLLPRVFERGISGSGSTGFGLDICKNTVEAHGGMIKIESVPGGGTTVILLLPACNGGEQ